MARLAGLSHLARLPHLAHWAHHAHDEPWRAWRAADAPARDGAFCRGGRRASRRACINQKDRAKDVLKLKGAKTKW